jgi:hypothetical protein
MSTFEYRQGRITPALRRTAAAARRVVAVVVADSLAEAKTVARAWKKSKIAGELVIVRRFTRKLKAAGAAVEIHVVVVSLRPPVAATGPAPSAIVRGLEGARIAGTAWKKAVTQ